MVECSWRVEKRVLNGRGLLLSPNSTRLVGPVDCGLACVELLFWGKGLVFLKKGPSNDFLGNSILKSPAPPTPETSFVKRNEGRIGAEVKTKLEIILRCASW